MTVTLDDLEKDAENTQKIISLAYGLAHPSYAAQHHAETAEEGINEIDKLADQGELTENGQAWWNDHRQDALNMVEDLRKMSGQLDENHPTFKGRPTE